MNVHSNHKILFVGLNTIDLQFLVNEFPAHNTKTKAEQNEIYVGGPATNAAIACAHLGGKVDLITPIGKHVLSEFIQEDILKYHVHIIDPIANLDHQPVFASIITSAKNGERTIFSYHPDKEISNIHELKLELNKYSLVLFDGFHPKLAIQLAKECRNLKIPTVLDGGSWKPHSEQLLDYIDFAVCSNDFMIPGNDDQNQLFENLHNRGVKQVAITRGEQSILYSQNMVKGEIELEDTKVVDTLGAGDIFHGAFCFYLSVGESFPQSLLLASKVASHSCQSLGTRKWMK